MRSQSLIRPSAPQWTRCLGSRGKRYESARELIAALRKPPKEPTLGRVAGLKGKRVSFTGFLVRPRADAIAAARKAGALVQSKPGPTTDILVRGRPNAQQIAGRDGGSKLIDVGIARLKNEFGQAVRREDHLLWIEASRGYPNVVSNRLDVRRRHVA